MAIYRLLKITKISKIQLLIQTETPQPLCSNKPSQSSINISISKKAQSSTSTNTHPNLSHTPPLIHLIPIIDKTYPASSNDFSSTYIAKLLLSGQGSYTEDKTHTWTEEEVRSKSQNLWNIDIKRIVKKYCHPESQHITLESNHPDEHIIYLIYLTSIHNTYLNSTSIITKDDFYWRMFILPISKINHQEVCDNTSSVSIQLNKLFIPIVHLLNPIPSLKPN